MSRVRRVLICLALLLAGGAASWIGPVQAQPAGAQPGGSRREVTVAMLAPSALMWVHAVAERQGFYAARGIAVKELRAGDSPALLQAVSSGSVNAGLSLGDLAIRAIDRGAPIVVAGAALDHAILRLYAAKDVAGIKGLNGAAVTAGAVRGGTADLLKYQVMQGGGDAAGLRLVSIANSRDRIVALGNGSIRAALLIAPFDTLAERDGFQLLDVYKAPYVETPLILNRDWAAKNRPDAVALVQAMKAAAAWMNEAANKDAAIDILAAYTSQPRDVCAESYAFIIGAQHAVPADFAVVAAGLENIVTIDAAVNGGAGGVPFDLAKYYDPSFLTP